MVERAGLINQYVKVRFLLCRCSTRGRIFGFDVELGRSDASRGAYRPRKKYANDKSN